MSIYKIQLFLFLKIYKRTNEDKNNEDKIIIKKVVEDEVEI